MKVNLMPLLPLPKLCYRSSNLHKVAQWCLPLAVGRRPRAFGDVMRCQNWRSRGSRRSLAQETQKTATLRFNCINPGAAGPPMRAAAYPSENPNTLLGRRLMVRMSP